MGWSIGYDNRWKRDIGYGVPAICDDPKCNESIDRGLSFVCGGEPYGGENGCGLYFCEKHRGFHKFRGESDYHEYCYRCVHHKPWYKKKPDTLEWIAWKLYDESWEKWREENAEEVEKLKNTLVSLTNKQ
jgi:hypothetical protein